MKLRLALEPILADESVLAVLVLTHDGLPVEMFGYGLRVDDLAAQSASIGCGARKACSELGLGEPLAQLVRLPRYELEVIPLDDYFLTVVSERSQGDGEATPGRTMEQIAPLRRALRGEE